MNRELQYTIMNNKTIEKYILFVYIHILVRSSLY